MAAANKTAEETPSPNPTTFHPPRTLWTEALHGRTEEVGATPLHAAAFRGSVSVARTLIEHGADVSAEDFCDARTRGGVAAPP